MQIPTIRFGTVDIDEKKTVLFNDGLPGLDEYKQFVIIQAAESYPIVWMQSTEDPGICLPVIDSFLAVPEYTFNIADTDVDGLGVDGPEDLHVLSVVVIPDNIEGMTINLAAPIIINLETGQAKQILLSGGDYNVRYPVFNEIYRLIKEENADAGSVKEDK